MLSLFSEFKETLPRVSSIQEFKNLLTTDYKDSHLLYNPLDNNITEFEALFFSKIILDELRDHFKDNPKKISHDFFEYIWNDSDNSDNSKDPKVLDLISENRKDIWRSKIGKIIIKRVPYYDTHDGKHSEIALCKWASRFVITEYIEEIVKKSLTLFVDEISKNTKISKKLLNMFNIIKLKLSLYSYKKFSKNDQGFSVVNEIPECSVVELVKIIDKLLETEKDLLFRPSFLTSSETNPITFSKVPEKVQLLDLPRIMSSMIPIDMEEEYCCWFC